MVVVVGKDQGRAEQGEMYLCCTHGLQVFRNLEWSFSLALDFVDGHALGDLDQGQTICKVDIENAL